MGNVKEAHWESDRRQSRERVAALGAQTSEAKACASEAALELERLKAPRIIKPEQGDAFVSRIKPFAGQTYWALLPPAGQDTEMLWRTLNVVLSAAGWVRVDPPGLVVGEVPHGVAVNVAPGIGIIIPPSADKKLGPAATALVAAMGEAGITAQVQNATEAEKKPDAILIAIGLKPQ